MSAVLTELVVGDDPESWAAAGFTVDGDSTRIGTVRLRLVGAGERRGILSWSLAGLDRPVSAVDTVDGLPTSVAPEPTPPQPPIDHPNGTVAFDHLVLLSPDLGRTTSALESLGIEPRRHRDVGSDDAPRRQVFFWIGEPVLELVGPREPSGDGPVRFFGVACTVADIDWTKAALGDRVGRIKDAVQPGRQITTLRHRDLDMSVPIAFMSPHVRIDTHDA